MSYDRQQISVRSMLLLQSTPQHQEDTEQTVPVQNKRCSLTLKEIISFLVHLFIDTYFAVCF